MDDVHLREFDDLKKIISSDSNQPKKTSDILINQQGFSDEKYEELQNAAKQLSGWEHEQLQGTEREISDSWEPEDVVTAAVITWLSERRE